jgi:hypothetical protein
MTGLSNAHHFRKLVAGACMVLGPLALLLAMVFESKIGVSEDAYVIGRVGDPDTGQIEQVLLVAGLVLMVPAVLGLMHMLRERGVEFGHLGGAVALLGLLVLPWALMAGLVVLAFGLISAKAVRPAWALCLAGGAVLLGLGAIAESEMLAIVGAAVTLVGMGSTGLMVLGETDEEWEHTPERSDFRPLAGTR